MNNMILQYLLALGQKRIVLASGSPQRKKLLGILGLKFEVRVQHVVGRVFRVFRVLYAIETARHKAQDVAEICRASSPAVDLIISADTVRGKQATRVSAH